MELPGHVRSQMEFENEGSLGESCYLRLFTNALKDSEFFSAETLIPST
jgi:hypothetical protein